VAQAVYVDAEVSDLAHIWVTPYVGKEHLVGTQLPLVTSQKGEKLEFLCRQLKDLSVSFGLSVNEIDSQRADDD